MAHSIRPFLAGNWKMNGVTASLDELTAIAAGLDQTSNPEALVCVPATLLSRAAQAVRDTRLSVGGQDCHSAVSGAHTGDVAAEMLADCGATHVIIGHSERRADHHETDEMVFQKAAAAWRAGLTAILCIGETRAEREGGETFNVLSRQIKGSVPAQARASNTIIAYEPVWAIGTGLTPTVQDVAAAHAHIRAELAKAVGQEAEGIRLLYGGSVKPDNAAELMATENVDGALVGGASLKSADFLAIAKTFE